MSESPPPSRSTSSQGSPPHSKTRPVTEGNCTPHPDELETDRLESDQPSVPTADWQPPAASTIRESPALRPPKRIARFLLGQRLGKGSYGVVFRAHDPQLERDVAIKVCRRSSLGDERAVQRFLREARAAGQLRHPYIVPIHEAGRDGDTYYIASGLIEGETLQSRLSAATPLLAQEAALLLARLADAVDYAHRHGIVHRDIKPANILINQQGEPQLADFGLARLDQADELRTQDGSRLGTPAYMSPEQARGDSHCADGRSDIWALGVVLYEILARGRPFVGDVSKIIHDILAVDPVRLRQIDASIPRDLETICLKCLAKNPNERFATAAELADELHRWLRGEPILSRTHSLTERAWRWIRRHPFPTAFIVTLITGAVTSAVLAIQWRAQVEVATTQTNIAKQALKDTQLAQQSLALRLAENLLHEGSQACEQHRITHGMLLFAEALQAMPSEPIAADLRQREETLRFSLQANLRAWSPQLGVLEFRLPQAHRPAIFTPDGTRFVTASNAGLVVWDASTGIPIGDQLDTGRVDEIACDEAGEFLVSFVTTEFTTRQATIRRWNLANRRPDGPAIRCGPGLTWSKVSRDALHVVTFHQTLDLPLGEYKAWDLLTGQMSPTQELDSMEWPYLWRSPEERQKQEPASSARSFLPEDLPDLRNRSLGKGAPGQPLPPIMANSTVATSIRPTRRFGDSRPLGLGVWRLCRDLGLAPVPEIHPFPELDNAERLQLWIEVSTGIARNQAGEFDDLSVEAWLARRKQLLHSQ